MELKPQLCTFGIDFECAMGEKGMTESQSLFNIDYFQGLTMAQWSLLSQIGQIVQLMKYLLDHFGMYISI